MNSQADRQMDIQKTNRQSDRGLADLWVDGLTVGWIGGQRGRRTDGETDKLY